MPVSKCGIQSVPDEELKHIWTKAEKLLRDGSSIVACPGYQRGFAVASSHDPSKPHVVTPLASGEIKCGGCPQFNRLSICSHSIAIAEKASILRKFLSWYTNIKPKPNFSQASNQGMPDGRGKKGERPSRKQKSKSSSSAIPDQCVDRIQTITQCTPAMQTTQVTGTMQTTQRTPAMQTSQRTPAMQTTQHTPAMQTTLSTQVTGTMQTTQRIAAMQTTQVTGTMQTTQRTPAMQTSQRTPAMQTTQHTPAMQTTLSTQVTGTMQTTQRIAAMQTTQVTGTMQTTQRTPAMQTSQRAPAMQTTQHTPAMQTAQCTCCTIQSGTPQSTQLHAPQMQATQFLGTYPVQTSQGTLPSYNMLNMHYPMYNVHDTTTLSGMQPFPSVCQPAPQQPYHNQNPFILQFQHGNIRKCAGCGGGIVKKSDKLILKHMERYQYPTGDPHQPVAYTACKERPHYYYAMQPCVLKRHPYFQPSMVDYSEVHTVLSEANKRKLVVDLHLFLP